MTGDLQAAAREFRALIDAPRDAVGVLGWGTDREPRIRVFAGEEWLRISAALPPYYAGFRVEICVRGVGEPYDGTDTRVGRAR
jgi:hypothetical protein